ncbi:hypothetical protein SeMB42_g04114 [Synchytrium endobioticum]|uniref:Uncharacterized protein n=1 Tax=Synchytrium endobioticum TaxID=286115 RepID=A0A507D0T4_9FUNG|nr:hypothetical protein SeMB42_g04114 [Synchytrium endobioticum]
MVPWNHSHHALPQDPGNARKELTRVFMACWVARTQTVSSKHGTIARAPINPPAGTVTAGIVINSAHATCCESLKAC